jgi:predicted Zn-dependent protease
MRYAAFVTDLQAGKFDKAKAEVAGLKDSVVYDELAALRLAKAQSEAGKGDDAIATLRGVPKDSRLRQLVDIRLAKLLIEAGKATEALALVDKGRRQLGAGSQRRRAGCARPQGSGTGGLRQGIGELGRGGSATASGRTETH